MKFKDVIVTCIRFGLVLAPSQKYAGIINIYHPWSQELVGVISKSDHDIDLYSDRRYKYNELSVEDLCCIMDAAGYPRQYMNELNAPETLNEKILELYRLWTMNPDLSPSQQLSGLAADIEKLGVVPKIPLAMSVVNGSIVIAFVNENNGVSLFTPDSTKPKGV